MAANIYLNGKGRNEKLQLQTSYLWLPVDCVCAEAAQASAIRLKLGTALAERTGDSKRIIFVPHSTATYLLSSQKRGNKQKSQQK